MVSGSRKPGRIAGECVGIQESLILRCPAGASKDEAGIPVSDLCKERRCDVSFEAILWIAPQDEKRWRMPPPGSLFSSARPEDS
ncbi:hypothetical protein ELI00_00580 [Rhizobium ruizarguesonis]|uniref:Uncharacterized protein n=1 Tax=Rhizobium leguminosarum bv. viciae TaxID=387 RepID=A0A8G2MQI2_RHILV|nr:hypothetical protein [Rhizobium leguminosarum bv. viciae]TAU46642.1 hypothetical protein ELI42_00565 [Rhizobium ruizarguesonis]NKK21340.1 hypothetical protein [Rhizobium leguminosarum bv. viciae]TAU61712.1 hypothetical protein ELI44_00565 [Rhizobium ruizarguesonis]TAX74890.1 hypothetical protein ELI00_00580 [Rhizobium ruizarguesonis]